MTRQRHREPSPRQLRVGEQIRHAIAEILERGNLRDPDLRGVAVTVTHFLQDLICLHCGE